MCLIYIYYVQFRKIDFQLARFEATTCTIIGFINVFDASTTVYSSNARECMNTVMIAFLNAADPMGSMR